MVITINHDPIGDDEEVASAMVSKRIHLAMRRKASGLSQEKFADQLGVNRSTVIRWETGESKPQPWVRPKIAQTLGISTEQLNNLLNDTNTDIEALKAPSPNRQTSNYNQPCAQYPNVPTSELTSLPNNIARAPGTPLEDTPIASLRHKLTAHKAEDGGVNPAFVISAVLSILGTIEHQAKDVDTRTNAA